MKNLVFEGWDPDPTGGLAVVWLSCHPKWMEPLVVFQDLDIRDGTPRENAHRVGELRRRHGVQPSSSVMLSEGVETLGVLDAYGLAGVAVSPAPSLFTEAMGVIRAVQLLRRDMSSPRFGSTKRLMVTAGCEALLAGLGQVSWKDGRPVLDGPGASAVRALAAAMIVLPPEPPDPVDVMTRLAREVMPRPADWDRRAAEPDLEGDVDYWGSFV